MGLILDFTLNLKVRVKKEREREGPRILTLLPEVRWASPELQRVTVPDLPG